MLTLGKTGHLEFRISAVMSYTAVDDCALHGEKNNNLAHTMDTFGTKSNTRSFLCMPKVACLQAPVMEIQLWIFQKTIEA